MLTLLSIIVPLVVGLVLTFVALKTDMRDYMRKELRITTPEFALASIVIVLLSLFVTQLVGPNLARNSAVKGYHEYYNGSVTKPVVHPDYCHRDGSCQHHYTCDHEEIPHPAQYDSKGNLTQAAWVEEIDHECPYVKRELEYDLETNIGTTIPIANGYFDAHPQSWRGDRSIPSDVPRQAPRRWIEADQHLRAGLSDPVTGVFPYENYILASDSVLFKKYGGSVAGYRKAGLIPAGITAQSNGSLYDYDMRVDKLQFARGVKVANRPQWQDSRFNTWRTGSFTARTFGGGNYPTQDLEITVGGKSITGKTALRQMRQLVVVQDAQTGRDTGKIDNVDPFATN